MTMRLQKYLAQAGVGSRRTCEEYIQQGRVSVNGSVVTEMGTKVERGDDVRFDGERVRPSQLIYLAVNKPRGVVCSTVDLKGRPRAIDLVAHVAQRLFTVGRLDADSSGLLLLTNDGMLTEKLTHPRFEVPKVYQVTVKGKMTAEVVERLRKGVYLAEGRVRCDRVEVRRVTKTSSALAIEIHQGINREIRRVLARVGFPVSELRRVAIGTLKLGTLKPGQHRRLSENEVKALYKLPGPDESAKRPRRNRRSPARRGS